MYLVANERPLINFDITLLINIGLWLVLFFLLRGMLWEPMLKLIAAREGGTEGAREQARTLQSEARKLREEYETKLQATRKEAAGDRDQTRAAALTREAQLISDARGKVMAAVERQRGELAVQRDAIRKELSNTVPELAIELASKVLGREVKS